MDRSAIDTIRGYCYQFDKSILEILALKNNNDTIEVEGIEDVDIKKNGELTAVQCKYYEKTSYNHSVIAKPIRLMLEHFSRDKKSVGKYYLFGHYKDGQEKLPVSIPLIFLKEKFLTYKKDNVEFKEHDKLGLSDTDLQEFLDKLVLNINAKSFDDQYLQVISNLMNTFSCSKEEATHYYYNSAFSTITKLGCNPQCRIISKSEFINKTNKTKSLFNLWLYKYKGRKQYLSKLKCDLFARNLNTQPYDRFFIIDVTSSKTDVEIKDCIYSIQKNWSNLSKRTSNPYSPYIYIYGKEKEILHSIKAQIYKEGLSFSDGYNFMGSDFCVDTVTNAKVNRDIQFQYIESESDLLLIIDSSQSRVEVYHFFSDENELILDINESIKNTKIQILTFEDIKELV